MTVTDSSRPRSYIIFLATTKAEARYAGVFLINCGAFVFGPRKHTFLST